LDQSVDVGQDRCADSAEGAAGADVDSCAHLAWCHSVLERVDELLSIRVDELIALASEDSSGSDSGVDLLDDGGGTSKERCSSISDGSAVGAVGASSADRDAINVELPVGGVGNRSVGERTSVTAWVSTSKSEFTSSDGGSRLSVKPEGEDRSRDEVLFQEVVPNRGHMVHGDGVEGHAEDTIELGEEEGDAWFSSHFGEGLSGDCQPSQLHVVC